MEDFSPVHIRAEIPSLVIWYALQEWMYCTVQYSHSEKALRNLLLGRVDRYEK
jgi:hypothetical protein